MAQFPALPLWTDAYLGDTSHLTTIEHGAYLLLLIAAWRTSECRLPNNDKLLARYSHLTAGQWRRIKPIIMEFFDVEGEWIYQGRLTDEREAVRQHCERQSAKAKSRWLKTKKTGDATGVPRECRSDAPTPTPTPSELPDGNSPLISPNDEENADVKKPKRASRIPESWGPDAGDIAYAEGKGFSNGQIHELAEGFRDYWIAASGTKATKRDWNAAWRTWVRNDIGFNGPPETRGNVAGRGGQQSGGVLAAGREVRAAREMAGPDDKGRIRF